MVKKETAFLKRFDFVNRDVYSKDVEITENIMSEEQYNELLKAYTKEAFADMIKADIRQRFPEPYASCKAACLEECLSS